MTSARARDRREEGSKTAPSDSGAKFTPNPLKPRKGLFVFLMAIFAVWVVVLLTMYFKTVYPQRHPVPGVHQPASARAESVG